MRIKIYLEVEMRFDNGQLGLRILELHDASLKNLEMDWDNEFLKIQFVIQ